MPSKQSDKKSSIQTHPADAIERAPFDRKEHSKHARQKKQEKADRMRGIVAYAILGICITIVRELDISSAIGSDG